ncbi:MAG: alpha/beta hydrolase [Terrisporobacter sp.]|uniref:alpha/beta hydrolase n=1 Tax=Terrisporobacter sp. TaxID=1965305 RepID=UPI002FCB68E6
MKIIIIIIILGLIILYLCGNYFYNLAINPKISKSVVFKDDSEDEKKQRERDEMNRWLFEESNTKDVYVNSIDNLKLHGYKIISKSESNNWAVIVHGYCSNVIKVGSIAQEYINMDYNVIMPELRGHGSSEGNYIGMGWHDRLDIIKWINYIIENNKEANIVLHGSSMGAATVMMTSGEELPKNIKVIIADCGYTSAIDQFSYQLKKLYKLKSFPILNVADMITKIKCGYSLKDASAVNQLKKCITPILFIHGDKDDFVPYYMMDELYNSVSGEKEKLTIKGAKHENARAVNPKLYWETVKNYLNKYVK